MKWLIMICVFLSVGTQKKCKQDKTAKVVEQTEETATKSTGQLNVYGKWAQAGINDEGRVFKLPPRRGGLEFYTFEQDGSIKYEGAISCGFGNYYLGTYTIDNKMRITATYTKKKQYMGEKEIEDVEFTQKFAVMRFDEKAIVLERYSSEGDVTVLPLIPFERYKEMAVEEFVD